MKKYELLYKKVGETPLEALERFRREEIEKAISVDDDAAAEVWKTMPMTYAGRLDPLAEGELLILIGDECKHKETYLGLDKEYEVEVLCGVSTDTHDVLGLVQEIKPAVIDITAEELKKYVGTYTQEYPAYSSKTVDGVPLHVLSRNDLLPEIMPTNEVTIRQIELLEARTITAGELNIKVISLIDLVHGDFRQEEIKARWDSLLNNSTVKKTLFSIIKIRVVCSSGTYMRLLAYRIGEERGVPACALGIKRTKIFL